MPASELAGELNLGPVSVGWLADAGITTFDELERLGTVAAFRRVRDVHPTASANLLYAIEGALLGLRWDLIPRGRREELKALAGMTPR